MNAEILHFGFVALYCISWWQETHFFVLTTWIHACCSSNRIKFLNDFQQKSMHCQLSCDRRWLVTTTSVHKKGLDQRDLERASFTWINDTMLQRNYFIVKHAARTSGFKHMHTTSQTCRSIVAPRGTEQQCEWVGECLVSGGLPRLCRYVSCLLLISANSLPPPLIFQQGRFYRFVWAAASTALRLNCLLLLLIARLPIFYPSPLPGAIWPGID